MKLSELEALAKAVAVNNDWSFWKNLTVVVPTEQYPDGDYIAAASPETILQMIALIRQLVEALEYVDKYWHGGALGLHEDALNALKEFDK